MAFEITSEQAKELKQALKNKANDKHYRKLRALLLRYEGKSLTAIGKEVGLVHQTIRNLITRYQEGGLSAILNETRGGRRQSYLTVEEEQNFLKEQLEQAIDGGVITIQALLRLIKNVWVVALLAKDFMLF